MIDVSLFEVGTEIEFDYPRHNFHGVLSKQERRRVRVTAVRDLKCSPLESQTRQMQPMLRRARWLVVGEDLDKGQERSFYICSMANLKALAVA